jgi:hypothetical protein
MIATLDFVQRVFRDFRQLRRSIAAEQSSSQRPWRMRPPMAAHSSKQLLSWSDIRRTERPENLIFSADAGHCSSRQLLRYGWMT